MKKCPICNNHDVEILKEIKSAKITESHLYSNIVLLQCNDCQHVFNDLSDKEIDSLKYYYNYEYILSKYAMPNHGENDFLGIDKTKSIKITQKDMLHYLNSLDDFNSKFDNRICGSLIMDQFLEHCWDIPLVIYNIKKSLSKNGYLYISVPDHDRYSSAMYKDYFYLIKEHVQHFTEKTILHLFDENNFKVVKKRNSQLRLMGGRVIMPSIEFLFMNANSLEKNDGTFCYGISREFLHLIENNKLKNIDGLIDDIPAKRGNFVNGLEIFSDEIIKDLSEKSKIIITSFFYQKEIAEKLKKINFKGKIKFLENKKNETFRLSLPSL